MLNQFNSDQLQNQLSTTIDDLVKHMQHSGCILISANAKIIYQKCFAYADYDKKIPITMNTQFLAGSVTKQFTAVAMLKALSDQNKQDIQAKLNHTIEHYLPKQHVLWHGSMPAWANIVTLHQLLVHSSGIPNYTSLPHFEKQTFYKNSDLISFFKNHELEFSPGEKFSYSNSGYFLLGMIIQELTQQMLDVYLENTLFKPLNMHGTFLPMQGTVDELIRKDARFTNLARGYQYDIAKQDATLEEVSRYEAMENPGAAGSLISTACDLITWNDALYTGKIIPSFLLALLLKPYLQTERVDAYYAYGIEIMKSAALGEYYSHRGGIPGFRSILTFIPALQLSIVTLQNIYPNQEKIMPEIEKVKAALPRNLSPEESLKALVKIIESKYPSIIENRKRYEFAPIYDEIVKTLENSLAKK